MTSSEKRAASSALIVALGGLIFGLDAALISGGIRSIVTQFSLNDIQLGTVVSAPGFGVIFALLVTGTICDRLGRKTTLLIIASLYLVSAVASVLAPNYHALVAARFLGGLAFTSLSVASIYIGEIAPPHLRGKLVSANQLNIVLGLSAAFFINYGIYRLSLVDAEWVATLALDTQPWRWMLGVEILPALLWLFLLMRVPQSPKWLLSQGRVAEAKAIMARFGSGDLSAESALIYEKTEVSKPKFSVTGALRLLAGTHLRKAALVGLLAACIQPMTGINAILFYAPVVFEQLGIGTNAALIQAMLTGVVSFVFTIVALIFIDRLGRRPLLISGLLLAVVSLAMSWYGFSNASYQLSSDDMAVLEETVDTNALAPLVDQTFASDVAYKKALVDALGFDTARANESALITQAVQLNAVLILFGIMGLIAAFHISIGPIMWVLLSEVFPVSVRSVAITGCALVTSVLSYFVQQAFPWQLANWGAANVFLFYGACVLAGLVGVYFLVPETKNKTIEEIEDHFRGTIAADMQEGPVRA